jgi:hypothetical protein
MGAIYPVFDRELENFDVSAFGGETLDRSIAELDAVAEGLGVSKLMDFFGAGPAEYLDEDELAEFEIDAENLEEKWFEPSDGLRTSEALLDRSRGDPSLFGSETAAVANELENLAAVLRQAREAGAKWHVEVEI